MKQLVRFVLLFGAPLATIGLFVAVNQVMGASAGPILGWMFLILPTLVGAVVLGMIPKKNPAIKISAAIAYTALMLPCVFVTGLMVACAYGDCF